MAQPQMQQPPMQPPQVTIDPLRPSLPPQEAQSRLKRDFEGANNRMRQFEAKKLMNANKLASVKRDVMRTLFRHLQAVGVDPSDLNSIRGFLEQLQQQDPDLATLFEDAFSGLLGDESTPPQAAGEESGAQQPPTAPPGNEGLMGRYGNLAGQVMRGVPQT